MRLPDGLVSNCLKTTLFWKASYLRLGEDIIELRDNPASVFGEDKGGCTCETDVDGIQ